MTHNNLIKYLVAGLLLIAAFGFAAFSNSEDHNLVSNLVVMALGGGAVAMLTKAVKEGNRDSDLVS